MNKCMLRHRLMCRKCNERFRFRYKTSERIRNHKKRYLGDNSFRLRVSLNETLLLLLTYYGMDISV